MIATAPVPAAWAGADLSVSVTSAPNPVGPGSNLVYSITVSNAGPDAATGIVLTNQLSPGQTVVGGGGACPSPGPVAWWKAQGNANDSAGSNNGTVQGDTTYASGQVGLAFSLDGSGDYVEVPDSPALRPASFTIEGWINPSDVSGFRIVIAKRVGASFLNSYAIYLDGGIPSALVSDGSAFPIIAGTSALTAGQWYHVALTFDDATKQQALYVNGSPVASGSTGFVTGIGYDANPVLLGTDIDNVLPDYFFAGLIDEMSIYDRVLSQTEIEDIYTAGSAGKCGGSTLMALSDLSMGDSTNVTLTVVPALCAGAVTNIVSVTNNVVDPNLANNTATSFATVLDTNAPVLTMLGDNPLTNECHAPFIDPGATAADDCDGAPVLTTNSTVNANVPGSYTIAYVTTDAGGNSSTNTRTVVIVDTTPPAITMLGANPLTNECHTSFTDPGATVADDCDGAPLLTTNSTVNANAPGSYAITYVAADATGNSVTNTRTVVVVDTTPPAIAMLGANPLTNECHAPFIDPGATAADDCDSAPVLTTNSTVNANVPGSYTITYLATDATGNSTIDIRTVVIADTTPPVVTMLGANPFSVALHGTFTDPGATATDACAGSVSVTTSGAVNVDVAGTYYVTYSALDPSGNSNGVVRTVVVGDSVPPSITQDPTNQIAECSTDVTLTVTASGTEPLSYQWYFFETNALPDATNSTHILSNVTSAAIGDYTVVVTNAFGSKTSLVATLTVVDTTPPTVTMLGADPLTNECHAPFIDPGATAADDCDSAPVLTTNSTVNANVPGSYTITYVATDATGNSATNTRAVVVVDTTPPAITMLGANPLTNECHTSFTDPGATVADDCDGAPVLTTNSTVNVNVPGSYSITYLATDAAGNGALAIRTVVIVDTTPPAITCPGNITVTEDPPSSGTATVTYTTPTGTDSCAGATPVTCTPPSGSSFALGTITVTCRSADGNLNTNTCTFTVTVEAAVTLPSDGLALWLKADAGVVTSSPQVTQWTDQSGNNHHATQGSVASQPTLESSVINGLPVVRFDGADDFLTFNLPINGLGGMSIFLVAANTQNQSPVSSQAEKAALFWNETAYWGATYLSPFQGSVQARFGTTQAGNGLSYTRPANVDGAFTITEAIKDSTTDSLYVNGALVLSQGGKLATIAGARDTGNLARGYDDNTYFAGDIAEVLVYTRALSATERQTVEAYFTNKYFVATPAPPHIVNQPANTTVYEPNAATFNVTATGVPTPSYQWRRGGVPIGGATSDSYTLGPTSVAADNGATFDVVVSNSVGSVTSTVATLTVLAPPPLPLSGLALWLKADAGVVGSPVNQWSDQSGNNRHATQGTSASQPTLVSSVVNGLPVVRFDGANDFMTFNLPVNGLAGMSIFLVAANTIEPGGSSGPQHAALFWNETAFWGATYLSPFQSAVFARFGTTQAGNGLSYTRATNVDGSFMITEAIKNGTTDSLYVNGTLVLSQGGKLATLAGARDTGNLARGYDDNTYFTGDIAEVLVYNRALSASERESVESYLTARYLAPNPVAPQITSQPANTTVFEPNPAVFNVTATGTPAPSYQWRRGGVPIGGAISSSYTLSPTSVAADNGATFDVVVSNSVGSVTSSVATLTVNAVVPTAPQITSQPANTNVYEPNAATFSVTATGIPTPSYQWRRGSLPIGGATSSSYTLNPTSVAADNGATFDVVVSNTVGSVTSTVATLTVQALPPMPLSGLALWLRADAGVIGSPVSQWSDQSGNNHHASQGSVGSQPTLVNSVLNGLPVVRFDGANDFLTFSLPVNGLGGMSLFLVAANTQNQSPISSQAERAALFWNETAYWGATYLTPFQGSVQARFGTTQAGNSLSYTRPANVDGAFTITEAIKDGTTDRLFVNGAQVLSQGGKLATTAGSRDTGNLARGYNDDTFFAGDMAEVLVYTRALSASERQAVETYLNAKYFTASPVAPQITSQPANTTVFEPNPATFNVTATGVPTPSYQWRRGGVPIGGATSDSYTLSPTSVAADNGATFDVVVSNTVGSVTSTVATLTVNAVVPVSPEITSQPSSTTVYEPNAATFSVTATGVPTPSYQWRRGGVDISGATGSSYTLSPTSVAADNVANFDVVVSNTVGSVTSTVATLTVLAPPPMPLSGLALWLKADAGVVTSSPQVTQWTDQSGNNHHATQGSVASQPTLVNAVVNGLPVVRFDGVNDFLTFNLPINGLTGVSIFLVAANTANPGGSSGPQNAALFWNETVFWGATYLSPFQGAVYARIGTTQAGNSLSYTRPANVDGAFTITEAIKDDGTDLLYVNGTLVLSQAGKLATLAGARDTGNLARGYDDNTYFAGDIAEVLVYDRTLSAAERQAVETYLNARYFAVSPAAPEIIVQPASTTAYEPNAATFSVVATGSPTPSYQWRRGGVPIGGANSNSYTLSPTSVAADNGATFDVVVTNSIGSVTSIVATLTVQPLPPMPTTDLALWLKADAGVVGSPVNQWSDQSGNDRHATQVTGASQPTLVNGALNGLPVVRFDGVDDFLTFNLPVNGLGGMTLFVVAANTQSQSPGITRAEHAALFWNETVPWGSVYLSPFQSSVSMRFGTVQTGNWPLYNRPSSVGSAFTLATALKDGTTDTLFVNGTQVLSEGGKLPAIAGCRDTGNVARGFDDNTYYAGDIAEVLVYARALTTTERQAVEQHLAGKYALSVAAPLSLASPVEAVYPTLQLRVLVDAGGTLQLVVSGAPDMACTLEQSTNLRDWTTVKTLTLPADGTSSLTVKVRADAGASYFRARLK